MYAGNYSKRLISMLAEVPNLSTHKNKKGTSAIHVRYVGPCWAFLKSNVGLKI